MSPDFVFTNGDAHRIDNDDLPEDKLTFDDKFSVTTNRTSLYCHFVINASRTFHQIKVGIWAILQQHRISWINRPAPSLVPTLFPWDGGCTCIPDLPVPAPSTTSSPKTLPIATPLRPSSPTCTFHLNSWNPMPILLLLSVHL
jgi:hypothetical protein